jgi:hypothetical protein
VDRWLVSLMIAQVVSEIPARVLYFLWHRWRAEATRNSKIDTTRVHTRERSAVQYPEVRLTVHCREGNLRRIVRS